MTIINTLVGKQMTRVTFTGDSTALNYVNTMVDAINKYDGSVVYSTGGGASDLVYVVEVDANDADSLLFKIPGAPLGVILGKDTFVPSRIKGVTELHNLMFKNTIETLLTTLKSIYLGADGRTR